MLLDKTALLQHSKPKTEIVILPEGEVQICELGAIDYLKLWTNPEFNNENGTTDMLKFIPALLAHTITDFDGVRMFSDSEYDSISGLNKETFLLLSSVAKRLNGLTGEEIKNSEASQEKSFCIDCACNSDTDTPITSLVDSQPAS